MMNSIDWLVVYFGIIRTGAWAVPLNFRLPAPKLNTALTLRKPG